ncbi:TRAP transporter large permease [Clostridiaceae bacterium 35-E11]
MNATACILLTFIGTLFLNVPVAFSLGMSALLTILLFKMLPATFMIQSLFSASDSFTLLAVPFFILTGDIMMHGGISKRLVAFCTALLGATTGGLGMITVLTCMIFASISGSGPATVAAIGGIMIPAMIEEKYEKSFACSLAATSGALGPIIPPSISFVMYGVIAGVSITDLFMAGIVPGIAMALALMIFVSIACKKHGFGIKRGKPTRAEQWKAFSEAKWALLVPIIILGGIYSGVFTPTEAAIIACDYGLIVGLFVYKEMTLKDLPKIFGRTALTSGTVLVLVGCATAFGKLLTIEQVPQMISSGLLSLTTNKFIILLLINMILFVTGMLMETLAAIVILAPLMLSVVVPLGVDPLHFGIIMVLNLVIGMCTPPVGVNIFVASKLGDIPLEKMFKWLIPMIGVLLIVLTIFTYVPELSMALPRFFK